MASRKYCSSFCKHCEFLEGIACLCHEMTFFWCCCCSAEHFLQHVPKLGVAGNRAAIKWLTYWILACEPACPSRHWLPEHSLYTQHEIYSLWAWRFQILSAGRAITSVDQCTFNQALPYHKLKGQPSVQHVPGPQAFWDLVADSGQYIGETMKYIFNHNSFHDI